MFCSVRVDGLSRIVVSCGESAAGEEEVRDSLGDGAGQAERGADDVNPSDKGVEVDMAAAELREDAALLRGETAVEFEYRRARYD